MLSFVWKFSELQILANFLDVKFIDFYNLGLGIEIGNEIRSMRTK